MYQRFFSKAIFISALCLISANSYAFEGMPPKVIEVEKIQLKSLKQSINLIGTINPRHGTMFYAKTSGTIFFHAKEGQVVKKGDFIAKIEGTDVDSNYELSRQAEAIAKGRYERSLGLSKSGIDSAAQLEEKKQALIDAQKNSGTAKEKSHFYAPFDGIIGSYKVREGEQVTEGEDPILYFYDPAQLVIDIDLPAWVVPYLKENHPVIVDRKPFSILHFQKVVDDETRMCPATVSYDGKDHVIGTTITVTIPVYEKTKIIVVPTDAVILKDGKDAVYTVKDNKVELVFVELGLKDKDHVEITSGLKVGDLLITKGQYRLWPTAPVKIAYQDNK